MMNLHILRTLKYDNLQSSVRTFRFLSTSTILRHQSELPKHKNQKEAIHETDHENSDDIDAIRDKSGLNKHLKSVMKGENLDLIYDYQFKLNNLRRHYGTHGEKSGLNPGLCYPTREELAIKCEYENLAYPPLNEVLEKVRNKQANEIAYKKNREAQIEKKMKLLPKLRKEMLQRQSRRAVEEKERIVKKESVIAEIREILGFNVDVNDPRFQELLEKRDLEEKKKRKIAKKEKQKEKVLQGLIETSGGDLKEKKNDDLDEDDDDDDDDDDDPKLKLKK